MVDGCSYLRTEISVAESLIAEEACMPSKNQTKYGDFQNLQMLKIFKIFTIHKIF